MAFFVVGYGGNRWRKEENGFGKKKGDRVGGKKDKEGREGDQVYE